MRVLLLGTERDRAGTMLERAARAIVKSAGAAPPVYSRSQKRVIGPRFRSLVSATTDVEAKIKAAIVTMRSGFYDRLGLAREADDHTRDADLAKYLAAVDAMGPGSLSRALRQAYEDLYQQGVSHVAFELEVSFDVKPTRALAALDAYALDFSDSVANDEKASLKELIRTAFEDGLELPELAREIREHFSDGVHRVDKNGDERTVDLDAWSRMVARTETARAQNAGTLDGYAAAGVERIIWVTANDERVCPLCLPLDGAVADLGENFEGTSVKAGPLHVGCFPSGARVALPSRASAATERWYIGNLVTIRTKLGYELTATENHPIATRRGWLPIASLQKGDDVLSRALRQAGVDPHVQRVETAIEEIAEAFPVSFGAMPTAAEDFHGDGAGSEVHVVRSDGHLRTHLEAMCDEHRGEFALILANTCPRALDSERVLLGEGGATLATADRIMSGGRVPRALLGAATALFDPVRLRNVAERDPSLDESTVNRGSADAEGFCQTLLALAGDVASDEIIDVQVESFQGFVYSVECEDGWFFADGIVAHNCRCTIVGYNALTKGLAREE